MAVSEQEQVTCGCGATKYDLVPVADEQLWWFGWPGDPRFDHDTLTGRGWSFGREEGYCVVCGDKCGPGPVVEAHDAELRRMAVEGDELSLRISLAQRALDGKLSGWRAGDE